MKRITLLLVSLTLIFLCSGALAAERIVSLTPSGTEILFALGVGDKVVGVSAMCDYPAQLSADLPRCGDYAGPNIEVIVSLDPDLVIAGNNLQQASIDTLKNLGINVIAAEAITYAGIKESIKLIADASGADATQVLLDMNTREAAILAAVQGQQPKTCYYAVSFYDWGDYSAGPGSFPYDMLTLLGLMPITSDMPYPWPMYTLEALVEKDPDIIFLSCDAQRAGVFMTAPGYKDLTATREGRVFICDVNLSARPTPRILDVMAQMARDAYGVIIE